MEFLYKNNLTETEEVELLQTLHDRFSVNMHRHPDVSWDEVEAYIRANKATLLSVYKMEMTGGEPDIVVLSGLPTIVCCVKETPKERKRVCYDKEARVDRKKYPPASSAKEQVALIGGSLLTEIDYKQLQEVEHVDKKTSSWLETPDSVRELGGAIFGDRRYERVFIYHNGAESYYQVRGYRVKVELSLTS